MRKLKQNIGVPFGKLYARFKSGPDLGFVYSQCLTEQVMPQGWEVVPSELGYSVCVTNDREGWRRVGLHPYPYPYCAVVGFHEACHAHRVENGKCPTYPVRMQRIWEQLSPVEKSNLLCTQIHTYQNLPPKMQKFLHQNLREEQLAWRYARAMAHIYKIPITPKIEQDITYSLSTYNPENCIDTALESLPLHIQNQLQSRTPVQTQDIH